MGQSEARGRAFTGAGLVEDASAAWSSTKPRPRESLGDAAGARRLLDPWASLRQRRPEMPRPATKVRQPCEVTRRARPTLSKAARRHADARIRAHAFARDATRRRSRARTQALAVAAAAGVGIAALVWWARQQKKDSELDDEADAPPPPRTEEAPKDAASGEAVKAEVQQLQTKGLRTVQGESAGVCGGRRVVLEGH